MAIIIILILSHTTIEIEIWFQLEILEWREFDLFDIAITFLKEKLLRFEYCKLLTICGAIVYLKLYELL